MSEDRGHEDVPVGQWTDVPEGKVVAPGTYVDAQRILRLRSNDAPAVWHLSDKWRTTRGFEPCRVRITEPQDISYDPASGAPWCPDCLAIKNLFELFGDNPGGSN